MYVCILNSISVHVHLDCLNRYHLPPLLHTVSPPWEGNHPLPRAEAMLWWILLSHLQQDLDVWKLVGQCWPVVSRLWGERLSPQAEAVGEARWTGLLWYEERAPSGTLPKVPGAWHVLQESQTAVVEAGEWLQDRVKLVLLTSGIARVLTYILFH